MKVSLLWLALLVSIGVSGCLMIDGEEIKALLDGLAKDNASACVEIRGGGGGGAIIPAPAVPMGGGWGSLIACRSNQPGSVIKVGTMKIEHGVYKIPIDQKELQELKDLKEWVREHGIIVVPGTPPSMNGIEAHEGGTDSS